jgi:hypothetical protein
MWVPETPPDLPLDNRTLRLEHSPLRGRYFPLSYRAAEAPLG